MTKNIFLIKKQKKYSQSDFSISISKSIESSEPKTSRKSHLIKLKNNFKWGKWSKEEDELLIKLVEIIGTSWRALSKVLKVRTSKQIRSRYINYLNASIDKSEFKKNEDDVILSIYPILKNKWTSYKNYLPNRTARAIESRVIILNRRFNFIDSNIMS